MKIRNVALATDRKKVVKSLKTKNWNKLKLKQHIKNPSETNKKITKAHKIDETHSKI